MPEGTTELGTGDALGEVGMEMGGEGSRGGSRVGLREVKRRSGGREMVKE